MCQGVCNLFTLYLRLNCFQIFLNSNRNSRFYECKNIAFVLTGCCLIVLNSFSFICKSCRFVNIIVHLFKLKAAFNFCWLLNYNIIIFLFTPFFLYFLLFFVFLSAILLAFQTCSNLLCFQYKEKLSAQQKFKICHTANSLFGLKRNAQLCLHNIVSSVS